MPRPRTPTCSKCGSVKVLISSGASRCLPCHRHQGREYYRRSPLRRAKARRAYVLSRYGISFEALEEILQSQGGRCSICKRAWQACPPAKPVRYERTFLHHLCVDHDHKRGNVRGLLCNACNMAIGFFEEDLNRFYDAATYLRRHRQEPGAHEIRVRDRAGGSNNHGLALGLVPVDVRVPGGRTNEELRPP